MFEIGQKVICVDDAFPAGIDAFHSALPFEGQVYTVRDLTPGETIEKQGAMAVLLAEIQGKINQLGIEHGFNSDRFRPLTEAEQEEVEQAALELETTI